MKKKYFILTGVVIAVALLDQWTKLAVTEHFRPYETMSLISGFFSLTFVKNTGAAFGILATAHPGFRIPFFTIVPVIALLAISYIFRKLPDTDLKLSSALSLVMGGAIGNLIDRLRLGYVIDFLDFHWRYQYHFPAFNVADAAICLGVGVLMLDLATRHDAADPANASRLREENNVSTAL